MELRVLMFPGVMNVIAKQDSLENTVKQVSLITFVVRV